MTRLELNIASSTRRCIVRRDPDIAIDSLTEKKRRQAYRERIGDNKDGSRQKQTRKKESRVKPKEEHRAIQKLRRDSTLRLNQHEVGLDWMRLLPWYSVPSKDNYRYRIRNRDRNHGPF